MYQNRKNHSLDVILRLDVNQAGLTISLKVIQWSNFSGKLRASFGHHPQEP